MTAGPVVVIHAGAGAGRAVLAQEERCRAALHEALDSARVALESGAGAAVAAEAAVRVLEDCDLFNAGRGAALNAEGTVELSAALMRGTDRAAGAVAGLRRTREPITAARWVLESDQVLLIGDDGDAFAAARGVEQVANDYFITERQRAFLQSRLAGAGEAHGTVGAVCRDGEGGLAAATSTGGISGQPAGRVGDSPLIGAGTWADDRVAVSCTGDGEMFVRSVAAHSVSTGLARGRSLAEAAGAVLADVGSLGGEGGLIAVDAHGEAVAPFLTAAMPRGLWRPGGEPHVAIGPS